MATSKYDAEVRWIPVSQAAKQLRVTRQRVYELRDLGAVVWMKVNSTVLINQRSVDARIALLQQEGRS